MEFITHENFLEMQVKTPLYYCDKRWLYYSDVINFIKEYFPDAKTSLELGCLDLPIVKNSATMDIVDNSNPTYLMDATKTPWTMIEDKQYDVFIGLQVFEHLGDSQVEVFKEVQRTCKYAVLSFPWMWHCPGNIHHMICTPQIKEWTCDQKPIHFTKKGSRIIYLFKF